MTFRLSVEDREFFSLVNQAAMANPFSDLRDRLDRRIAGRYSDPAPQRRIDLAIAEVGRRIEDLERRRRADINAYAGDDRRLMANTFLFDMFHRFIPKFDAHIAAQLNSPKTVTVRFATAAMSLLQSRGFALDEARRYFELCFQMRRAFYFIQHHLVGRSACMRTLRESLWNNVFTHDIDLYDRFLRHRMEDFSTLILGATGTGKGTAAAAIGRSGYIPFDPDRSRFAERFTDTFTALNLSQFSETLIESELFGHTKGAFTGAVDDYQGVFDRCSAFGAIFLDEIGEVGQPVQIKLLQVLQERRFTPVGSHQPRRFDGRVIAATNRTMSQLRGEKRLRDDFFYRLCSDVIVVPPLAERIRQDPAELDDLVEHTVTVILGKPSEALSRQVTATIKDRPGLDYRWPGNVRELAQCIRSILLNHRYTPYHDGADGDPTRRLTAGLTTGNITAQQLLNGYCYLLYRRHGTFEAVARIARLDRRTARKYVLQGEKEADGPPPGR